MTFSQNAKLDSKLSPSGETTDWLAVIKIMHPP